MSWMLIKGPFGNGAKYCTIAVWVFIPFSFAFEGMTPCYFICCSPAGTADGRRFMLPVVVMVPAATGSPAFSSATFVCAHACLFAATFRCSAFVTLKYRYVADKGECSSGKKWHVSVKDVRRAVIIIHETSCLMQSHEGFMWRECQIFTFCGRDPSFYITDVRLLKLWMWQSTHCMNYGPMGFSCNFFLPRLTFWPSTIWSKQYNACCSTPKQLLQPLLPEIEGCPENTIDGRCISFVACNFLSALETFGLAFHFLTTDCILNSVVLAVYLD